VTKNTNSPVCDSKTTHGSSTPLMTRKGSNFYNTESGDVSKNNTGRRHERDFWVQNPGYKRGSLFSL